MTSLTIKPAAAPLTDAAQQRRRIWRPTPRALAFAALAATLVALLGWVILALPTRIAAPETPPSASRAQRATPAADVAREVAREATPPFRRLELERAEREARKSLGRFVELQRQLRDEMNVMAWGEAQLAASLDRATAADQLFLEERYDASLAEYEAAGADLDALRQRGIALRDDAIRRGEQALAERRSIAAADAFAVALAIAPQSAEALAGARRAAAQPQALSLMREGERARLRGGFDAAIRFFEQARAVDPLTEGIAAALTQARGERDRQVHEARLSAGFEALAAARYDAARTAFEKALAARPQDAAAADGLAQTRQRQTLARIERLRAQARRQEAEGDWQGARDAYAAALDIDASLRFARAGQARLRRRLDLIERMNALLADPAALSEDAAFAAAATLLEQARTEAAAGAAWRARIQSLADLLAQVATPVPLVLVSDNATDVTIFRVGALGRFERRELSLRPGRYTIVGSRDGCRDVRKEIVLAADAAPVTVRCEERI